MYADQVLGKALGYNFSFGKSLSKQLQNLMKVNKSSLTKITNINLINLILTELTTENLKNLLLSKFELSLGFDNSSYQVDNVDYFCN